MSEARATISPPKKRPARHFSVGDKEGILNIYKAYARDYPDNPKTQNVELTAKAAGVSVQSVFKILREYSETHELRPPKVYHRQRAILDTVDGGTKSALRRLMHSFFERNEQPTLDKILAAVHEDEQLPQFKRSTLWKLINEIGIICNGSSEQDFTNMENHPKDLISIGDHQKMGIKTEVEESVGLDIEIKEEFLNTDARSFYPEDSSHTIIIKTEKTPDVSSDSAKNPPMYAEKNVNEESLSKSYEFEFVAVNSSNLKYEIKHEEVEPLQCNEYECDYVTEDTNALETHQLTPTTEENSKEETKNEVNNHQRRLKPFKCTKCRYRTHTSQILKKHQVVHQEIKPFECDKCSYKAKRKLELKRHQLFHKDISEVDCYSCTKCDYVTKYKSSLTAHQVKHIKNIVMNEKVPDNPQDSQNVQQKPFMCTECSFRTHSKQVFRKHHIIHRGLEPLECDKCSFRTHYRQVLKKHQIVHTEVKPFECDQCSYKARRKIDLKRHQVTHKDIEEVESFSCKQCDYVTKHKRGLATHQLIHLNNSSSKASNKTQKERKPFKCDKCSYIAHTRDLLKKHEVVHSEIKPFKCSICSYQTHSKTVLKKHEIVHTDVKPFECDKCSFKAKTNRHLTRHQLVHTDVKPFHCDRCPYKAKRKMGLTRHQQIHNDIAVAEVV